MDIIEPIDMLGRSLDVGDTVAYPIGGSSPSMCVAQIEKITQVEQWSQRKIDGKWQSCKVLGWKPTLKPVQYTGYRETNDYVKDANGKYKLVPKPNGAKSVTITKVENLIKVELVDSSDQQEAAVAS
jgi:hypothetical protein